MSQNNNFAYRVEESKN